MELKQKKADQIAALVSELFEVSRDVELTIPDAQFGDYSTNVAMQLAGKLNKNPREIAQTLADKLTESGLRAEVAGPGFINLWVSDIDLWKEANKRDTNVFAGKVYVIEYSCPNYFKEFHAGHVYQTIAADVVARLVERSGAVVHRTNFGGDVGLHVGRAMWAIIQDLGGEDSNLLSKVSPADRPSYISARYVEGSSAHADGSAKEAIEATNKRVYEMHRTGDTVSEFAKIYFICRDWSKDYFVDFYNRIQVTEFEKYYPESITHERGLSEVSSRIGTIFKESQGAVVFEGEQFGLHTRVFITKEGLPTYEAKDIGLILMETEEFKFDHRILFTGRDQQEYMRVVWKAMDQILPGAEAKMTHIVNGIVKFGDGQKMSSRSGNVTTATDVLESVKSAVGDSGDSERDERIYLGALKYEFLKHRLEGDMSFDPKESVSLQGNSGPYLQYALVRAKSILAKSETPHTDITELEQDERQLVRKLAEYQVVLSQATADYVVHTICSYLYELAQEFNKFYENNLVVGDPREAIRLSLVKAYVDTLEDGLIVLGIQAPEKM